MKKQGSPFSPLPPVKPGASSFFRHSTLRLRHLLALLTTASAALLLSACTLTTYSSATGEHLSRIALGSNTSVQSLSLAADTNGLRRVELRGYAGDNTQALGTVTDAAVKAAIQAATK